MNGLHYFIIRSMNTPTATTEFNPDALKRYFNDECTLLGVYIEELERPGQNILDLATDEVSTLLKLVPAVRNAVIGSHCRTNGAQIPELTQVQIKTVDDMARDYILDNGEVVLMLQRFIGPTIEDCVG
jgi:hypothetical protein